MKLTVEIHRENEWYIAFCREIPEANGQGTSEDEALESLRKSISLLQEDSADEARKNGAITRELVA